MNRLWVRFSIVVGGVVLFVALLIASTVLILSRSQRPFPNLLRAALQTEQEQQAFAVLMSGDVFARIGPEIEQFNRPLLLWLFLLTTGATIFAGVIFSRSLTRPLEQLQTAALAIGRHELKQQVKVSGTLELQALATAFNQMYADLQAAEQARIQQLNDVAHELRTPLTVIQGNLRALLDDIYPLSLEEVARIYEQTRHLSHLVQDLRDLAQAEAQQLRLDLEPFASGPWLQLVFAQFEPLFVEQGRQFHLQLAENLPILTGDRKRLTQCLANLLHNALQYTQVGDRITLTADTVGPTLVMCVIDNGQGLAPEQLPNLFNRFYRAKLSTADTVAEKHSGLGLAIVRSFMALHGGRVFAYSAGVGQGSIFTLELPVV
jgi:signal transduction histidine kinase